MKTSTRTPRNTSWKLQWKEVVEQWSYLKQIYAFKRYIEKKCFTYYSVTLYCFQPCFFPLCTESFLCREYVKMVDLTFGTQKTFLITFLPQMVLNFAQHWGIVTTSSTVSLHKPGKKINNLLFFNTLVRTERFTLGGRSFCGKVMTSTKLSRDQGDFNHNFLWWYLWWTTCVSNLKVTTFVVLEKTRPSTQPLPRAKKGHINSPCF